jgi:glycosyltransferase involved in cell wall biosynthesis
VVEHGDGVRVVHVAAGPARSVPKDELWPFMSRFRDEIGRFAGRETHGYDIIHGNFWMSGWVAAELGSRWGAPVVQIFHAMGKTKKRHQGTADTSPDERIRVERDVIRRVDRLIAQCPSERDELIDDYGADPRMVALIPSAVDTGVFRPVSRAEARRRLNLPVDEPVVVYVGRILPRKDVRNVVRGVAALTRRGLLARLLLVGGETPRPDSAATPEIGELKRLAASLNIADRVHFVGKRERGVLRYYYAAGDVAVTTPWYEPFGLTPLEAMACGRPVVGSAVGGIAYTVADGETGYLVPPSDPERLADRLQLLLTNAALCRRMGEAARARVERLFTWEKVGRRTAELYSDLLAEREETVRPVVRVLTGVSR